jgi:hypothetical protein
MLQTKHKSLTSINSVAQGNFAMVVTNFGNTDGYCTGTGGPMILPQQAPVSQNNPYQQLLMALQGPQ